MPVSPYSVSKDLNLNPNSVRARLSELSRFGPVERVFHGHYSIAPTYRVGEEIRPLIHDLRAVAVVERVFKSDEWSYEYETMGHDGLDTFKVWLQFGKKRNKITCGIKSPLGLDLDKFRLVRRLVECELARRDYVWPMEWSVTVHFNKDYFGIRLDGLKCITWDDIDGIMVRFYNKGKGLRREVVTGRPISLLEVEALLQGGMSVYQVVQAQMSTTYAVKDMVEKIDKMSWLNHQILKQQQSILEALYRLLDNNK